MRNEFDEEKIIREGWNTLTEKLGHSNSVLFISAIAQGKGDSVKELKEYWEGKTLKDVEKEINDWKEANNII